MGSDLEQRDVEEWRFEQLERAGYDAEAALLIAADFGVDLHLAIDLLCVKGATVDEALRILL